QRIESERKAAETEKRELELQRRLEALQDQQPGERFTTLVWEQHSFILKYAGPKAHERWQKQLRDSTSNKKIDIGQVNRDYSLASIVDWNGATDLHGMASEHGLALLQLAQQYPGIVTSIQNRVHELAGIVLEEHKTHFKHFRSETFAIPDS